MPKGQTQYMMITYNYANSAYTPLHQL